VEACEVGVSSACTWKALHAPKLSITEMRILLAAVKQGSNFLICMIKGGTFVSPSLVIWKCLSAWGLPPQ
jgi:hypothetical protein